MPEHARLPIEERRESIASALYRAATHADSGKRMSERPSVGTRTAKKMPMPVSIILFDSRKASNPRLEGESMRCNDYTADVVPKDAILGTIQFDSRDLKTLIREWRTVRSAKLEELRGTPLFARWKLYRRAWFMERIKDILIQRAAQQGIIE